MDNSSIRVTVYQRIRRYGTKGKTRGAGHAKSVVKLVNELEIGQSIWSSAKKSVAESANAESPVEASTEIVADWENVLAEEAVLFLDRFEKSTDNVAANRKMATYTEKKERLLSEYGVKSSADLTEVAKERFKKELAKASFKYWEYQVVVTYGDGKKVHSHRMKLVSPRGKNSWVLPKVGQPTPDEAESDNDESSL